MRSLLLGADSHRFDGLCKRKASLMSSLIDLISKNAQLVHPKLLIRPNPHSDRSANQFKILKKYLRAIELLSSRHSSFKVAKAASQSNANKSIQ